VHVAIRDSHKAEPGTGFGALRWTALAAEPATVDDEERLDLWAREILAREGVTAPTQAEVDKIGARLLEARKGGYGDVARASKGDYSENPVLKSLSKRTRPKVDIKEAFEHYCSQPRIKGGLEGPTAKRWRPVIDRFADWIGHRDLARVTPQDAVRWRDHMISQGITPKAVRDVWLAAPRSVATHMLNALKLEINPFAGIRVEGVKAWKEDDERGFDPDQALTILSATVATPSHLISREMKAARRWVPMDLRLHGRPRQRDHVVAALRRAEDSRALVLRPAARDHQGQAVTPRPGARTSHRARTPRVRGGAPAPREALVLRTCSRPRWQACEPAMAEGG
jgi:hypothetical protein